MSRARLDSACWIVDFDSADLHRLWAHHPSARDAEVERATYAAQARQDFLPAVAAAVAAAGVRQLSGLCRFVTCDGCGANASDHLRPTDQSVPVGVARWRADRAPWSTDGAGRDHCPDCPDLSNAQIDGQLTFDDVFASAMGEGR